MADDTTSDFGSSPPQPSASHSSLRIVTIATFLPAVPLCIAHGVLSNHPVPAVGLVPLAFSASGAVFLLRRGATAHDDDDKSLAAKLSHPVLVFACDVILAAALMVVLVFTWIAPGGSASLSMLAAYATIPLLVNFCVHLLLALQSFYTGLAIHSLVQWLAWRTLPPDCPNCNHRLRPPFPELPWVERVRRRRDDYAALFVDEEHRYRDEEEGEEPVHDAEQGETSHGTVQPEAVEVKKKKERKGKTTPPSTEDPASPWGP
ncbi:hypothetical protein BGZ61DRAFT_528228 [Ilyonectria robusta]|uniref:uncharacterized protein n=1 Tax=Ilyonectria robusta TaxID=1079257 RepID=UPI001E8E7A93|nr:uncharacterized protein BGZ61DRAFT_528228 [Ilyonectria robusta]KAH6990703.1 hypothetical protein BKA56DRAFT_667247 [Ilyonectria sp. MPI-CAGE-AT-0026]KAH8734968.1 hypothetical protein BGZ61DRAFT_528228 [Ilyonectria robusta]